MGVPWHLARVALRRRTASFAGLALLVATGSGVALAALETAHRTQRAYPDYLRRANVAELVVNPGLATVRAEEIITATPGVVSHTTDDFLIATIDVGAPRTQAEVESGGTFQVRMSSDGRYVTSDRPVVHDGRMVRDGAEAFLSRDAADALGVGVGDEIPLAFWEPSYNIPDVGNALDEVVGNVGTARAVVVGVGVFADEVLADELYPRRRILVTPDVAGRFTCTLNPIDPDDTRPLVEAAGTIVPDRCALAYRFFSLQLEGGDAAAGDVAEHLAARFEEENARIPEVLRAADVGYIVIPSATRDERERLDRSLRPAVDSLRVFALGAGVATAIVASLLLLRITRRETRSASIWRELGLVRAQRFVALAIPAALASVIGIVAASVVGIAGSALGPIASARALVPHRRFGVSADAAMLVLGATAIVLAVAVTLVAVSVARLRPQRRHAGWLSRLSGLARSWNPVRALGLRAAVDSPGSGPVLLGAITGVAVVVASVVFSTSLGGLIGTPARYGWPYDAAVMIGFGYGGSDEEAIARSLDRPEVERWGLAALTPVTVRGRTVGGVAALDGFAEMPLDIVDGRAPRAVDEVALGSRTAAELGVDVGESLDITTYFGAATVTLTGTVVLPPVGAYEADRASAGIGVLLPRPLFDDLVARAEQEAGIPPGSLASTGLGAFTAIDLAEEVDAETFVASLGPERLTWDRAGFEPFTYTDPVRPAAIADAASLRGVPVALGAFFALAMALGLFVGIAVATRSRARELAVLRALGAPGRDLAGTVRWHALAVIGVALLVGAPLGVLAGRLLFRAFASDVGVVPRVIVSAPRIAAVAAVAIVVGLVAAAGPGRRWARHAPAQVLRDE